MSLLGKLIDSLLANAPQLKVLPISLALGNGRRNSLASVRPAASWGCQRLQLFGRMRTAVETFDVMSLIACCRGLMGFLVVGLFRPEGVR